MFTKQHVIVVKIEKDVKQLLIKLKRIILSYQRKIIEWDK